MQSNSLLSIKGISAATSRHLRASAALLLLTLSAGAQIQAAEVTLIPIDANHKWRYENTGKDLGTTWKDKTFSDSAWPEGAAILGLDADGTTEPIRTVLTRTRPGTTGRNIITDYFRTKFNFSGNPATAKLQAKYYVDDGLVIYLNGVEVNRFGVPDGPVTATTLVPNNEGRNIFSGPFDISNAALVAGENVLAVEVHQSAADSSDVIFGLELKATVPDAPAPPPPQSVNEALMFVGNPNSLNAAEQAITNRLALLGFNVQVRDDNGSTTSMADGKGLIFVSGTVGSGEIAAKFRGTGVPLISGEEAIQDDMLWTLNAAADRGTVGGQRRIRIVRPDHPLAGGLTGTVQITSDNRTFNFGKPGPGAVIIAVSDDGTDRAVLYAYDKDAPLINGTDKAAQRGVGSPMQNDTAAGFNEEGWTLFDSMVLWATANNEAPTISSQPASITVNEGAGRTATFAAIVRGQPPFTYQWQRNGADIPGATGRAYTTAAVRPSDNNAEFRVRITNAKGSIQSDVARLTVVEDVTAPTLVSAVGSSGLETVTLTFSESISEDTATNLANYSISSGLTVSGATLAGDGSVIVLTTSPQTPGTEYTVTINNLKDRSTAGNAIAAGTTARFTAWVLAQGFLLREVYSGFGGVAVADLTNNVKYPSAPDSRNFVRLYETPTDVAENYGVRLSGFLIPPETGDYVFYMSSDDGGALFLSTDENPANKTQIAREPTWNPARAWLATDRRNAAAPENRSAPIRLEAGRRYYTEALMKEGGGGDNLGVTWKLPSQATPPANGTPPIGAQYLATFANPENASITITQQPASTTALENTSVTFTLAARATLGASTNEPISIQWQKNGIDIPGATGTTLTVAQVTPTDSASTFRAVLSIPTKTVLTDEARLTVQRDVTPPSIVAARSFGRSDRITITFSEPIADASAANVANYSVAGATVQTAVKISTNQVELTTTPVTGRQFAVVLSGSAERPNPVTTTGRGSGTLSLNGNQLTFNIAYSDLPVAATAAHIHGPGTVDQAVGVMVSLAPFNGGAFGTSGTLAGTVTLTPEQLAALVDGKTYVNIHTAANPGGEIRGQIAATQFVVGLSGAAERPNPVSTTGAGSGRVTLVDNLLSFNISYAGLSGPATAAHFHGPGTADQAVGVQINLAPFNGGRFGTSGSLFGAVTLTPDQLAMVRNGLLYANIHTAANPGGEIRGQLAPLLTGDSFTTVAVSGVRDRAAAPNAVAANSLVAVNPALAFPADFGQTVAGFQDDFNSATLDPNWRARGPTTNVYSLANGLLRVRTAAGDPNHLLYELGGYNRTNQEVLARVRVTAFGTGDAARGGISVGVGTDSQGINWHFRDHTQDGITGRQIKLLDDLRSWGPGYDFRSAGTNKWQNNSWYWMRLKQVPNSATGQIDVWAKIWSADGTVVEPDGWNVTWDYVPTRTARSGFAGIAATSNNGRSEFDVDYILIKADGLSQINVGGSKVGQKLTAGADGIGTTENTPITVSAVKLLANDDDPEGGAISLTGASSTSAQGGNVTVVGDTVTFTPKAGFTGRDTFTYTISSASGATATGTVEVTVSPAAAPSQNLISIQRLELGTVIVQFVGIPGRAYRIQASTDLQTWTDIGTASANFRGAINFIDLEASNFGTRFYRTVPQ